MPISKSSGSTTNTEKKPMMDKYAIGRKRMKNRDDGGQMSPVNKMKYHIGEARKQKTGIQGYGDNGPIPGNGHPGACDCGSCS